MHILKKSPLHSANPGAAKTSGQYDVQATDVFYTPQIPEQLRRLYFSLSYAFVLYTPQIPEQLRPENGMMVQKFFSLLHSANPGADKTSEI